MKCPLNSHLTQISLNISRIEIRDTELHQSRFLKRCRWGVGRCKIEINNIVSIKIMKFNSKSPQWMEIQNGATFCLFLPCPVCDVWSGNDQCLVFSLGVCVVSPAVSDTFTLVYVTTLHLLGSPPPLSPKHTNCSIKHTRVWTCGQRRKFALLILIVTVAICFQTIPNEEILFFEICIFFHSESLFQWGTSAMEGNNGRSPTEVSQLVSALWLSPGIARHQNINIKDVCWRCERSSSHIS